MEDQEYEQNILEYEREENMEDQEYEREKNIENIENTENTENSVNIQIINETNNEMKELENDIRSLSEISMILAGMIELQGEEINQAETKIEESVDNMNLSIISLNKAEGHATEARGKIKNAAIILGTITAGAFGFIAGPLIGIATTISGVAAGIGIIFVSEKRK